MSELFTLCCWIRGHPVESIFCIETSPNEDVGAVKQKIKDSGSDTLRDVAPFDPVPFYGLSAVTLSTSGEPLPDALEISDIFVMQPHKCHIHLIVGMLLQYKVAPVVHLDFRLSIDSLLHLKCNQPGSF